MVKWIADKYPVNNPNNQKSRESMGTKSERLNSLYKKYGLTSEDIFKSPQKWVIITRSGVDKIQAAAGIDIKYTVEALQPTFVVVKATASMIADKEIFVETFGEADCGTDGSKSNCRQNYPVAMAEKRAMSRAVLKLSGFYAEGVYSEDEADDFGKAASAHKKSLVKEDLSDL